MDRETVTGSLLAKAHELVAAVVAKGDTVVDATLGNGHDTLFLARCVGEGGKVIGFDVQAEALQATQVRLSVAGVAEARYQLVHRGHEEMAQWVAEGIAAVMFNLGYLPGSDKSIITRADQSIVALGAATDLLKTGGILSVMCYPGHGGGEAEAGLVLEWMSGLAGRGFSLTRYDRESASDTSPFLVVAMKGTQ